MWKILEFFQFRLLPKIETFSWITLLWPFFVASPALPFVRCSSWIVRSNLHRANNMSRSDLCMAFTSLADVTTGEKMWITIFWRYQCFMVWYACKCEGSSGVCDACAVCADACVTDYSCGGSKSDSAVSSLVSIHFTDWVRSLCWSWNSLIQIVLLGKLVLGTLPLPLSAGIRGVSPGFWGSKHHSSHLNVSLSTTGPSFQPNRSFF